MKPPFPSKGGFLSSQEKDEGSNNSSRSALFSLRPLALAISVQHRHSGEKSNQFL